MFGRIRREPDGYGVGGKGSARCRVIKRQGSGRCSRVLTHRSPTVAFHRFGAVFTRPLHGLSFTNAPLTPYHTYQRLPRRVPLRAWPTCRDTGTRVPEDREGCPMRLDGLEEESDI